MQKLIREEVSPKFDHSLMKFEERLLIEIYT